MQQRFCHIYIYTGRTEHVVQTRESKEYHKGRMTTEDDVPDLHGLAESTENHQLVVMEAVT